MSIEAGVEVRLGDVGTVLAFTIKDEDGTAIDLTAASTLTLRIQKPDRTVEDKTLTAGGALGEASYTIVADDLDQVGTYRLQTYVVTPAGSWRSSIDNLRVHFNLPVPTPPVTVS